MKLIYRSNSLLEKETEHCAKKSIIVESWQHPQTKQPSDLQENLKRKNMKKKITKDKDSSKNKKVLH